VSCLLGCCGPAQPHPGRRSGGGPRSAKAQVAADVQQLVPGPGGIR
jgi:hypothetical protein